MSWQTTTLNEVEDSLRKLEESIHHVRAAWPVTGADTNGPAGEGSPTPESLRQLTSELSDILRRCENLPREAILAVESAWENLEANKLPDWDAVGGYVFDLLTKQAEAIAQAANLVCRGERSGMPPQSQGNLSVERSLLLERAQDFRDSWPWSTGNKPGDEEDAAGAREALEDLPSFDVLWRLARKYPPPPGWLDEE